ncbi:uncharacterized membrane protein (DUF485 family) [Paraburkholderia sp. RAU6.4a]|uniref:DUF485 domain-containing protein n=1 Tax=Paraburkholderia sp. RAU6.4a TaxID=2991067 RepID=UPI003D1F00B5
MQAVTLGQAIAPPLSHLRSVAIRRQRVSLSVTVALLVAHFAFVCSIAYYKPQLAYELMPGLSLAIVVGFSTVAFALVLTFGYVTWIDRVHDKAVRELHTEAEAK